MDVQRALLWTCRRQAGVVRVQGLGFTVLSRTLGSLIQTLSPKSKSLSVNPKPCDQTCEDAIAVGASCGPGPFLRPSGFRVWSLGFGISGLGYLG